MSQRRIPSNLQLPCHQSILWVGGFVAPLGEARLITCRLQFERKCLQPCLLLICGALCCLKSRFDCAPANSPEYFGHNTLFWLGPSERDARPSYVNDPQSPAHVTHEIASPAVVGVQHAATLAAPQMAGQQPVATAASFPVTSSTREIVLAQSFLVLFKLAPGDIAWMVILYQNAPFFDGLPVADGLS